MKRVSLSPEEQAAWLERVRVAAARRDNAAALYSRRLALVRSLMREANDAGVPVTEIAKAGNVARSRAHRLISNIRPGGNLGGHHEERVR